MTASPTAARPSTSRSASSPSARWRPWTTTSRMSPKANRSPVTVPEKLARSSVSPVRKPVGEPPGQMRRRPLLAPRPSRAAPARPPKPADFAPAPGRRSSAPDRCRRPSARPSISRSTSCGSPATALRICSSLSSGRIVLAQRRSPPRRAHSARQRRAPPHRPQGKRGWRPVEATASCQSSIPDSEFWNDTRTAIPARSDNYGFFARNARAAVLPKKAFLNACDCVEFSNRREAMRACRSLGISAA